MFEILENILRVVQQVILALGFQFADFFGNCADFVAGIHIVVDLFLLGKCGQTRFQIPFFDFEFWHEFGLDFVKIIEHFGMFFIDSVGRLFRFLHLSYSLMKQYDIEGLYLFMVHIHIVMYDNIQS